ncbi:MAG: LamG-like jellyroll fold domain-containing protein [Bacteroidota bacterium]
MKIRYCFLLLTLCVGFSTVAQVDLEDGLVGHYPFNGSVDDVTDFANNGMNSGAISAEGFDGITNGAWEFDGATAFLQIPHSPQNDFMSAESFAISIWLKMPETQGSTSSFAQILMKWTTQAFVPYPYDLRLQTENSSTSGMVTTRRYDGEAVGCIGESIAIASNNSLNDNTWHHLVYQKEASTNELQYYVDGVLQGASQDTLQCEVSNSADLRFGRREGTFSFPFKGALDEFRIYERALNEDEIIALSSIPSSVKKLSKAPSLSLFPNPVSGDHLTVRASEEILSIQLMDLNGNRWKEYEGQSEVNVSGLSQGVYIMRIQFKEHTVLKRFLRW